MAHSSCVESLQICIQVEPLILIYKEFGSFAAVGAPRQLYSSGYN